MSDAARRLAPPAFVVVALTVAAYLRVGYGYGTGDQEELLPQLLRALDQTLFASDPYLLNEEAGFSVRFVFLGLLRVLCLVVPPPVAVFVVSVAAWAGVGWAAFRLCTTLVPSRAAATAAVLASYATIYWTPGSNALLSPTLAPESIAWAPALLAVAAFLRGRPLRAAVLLGVTAWIQTLIGLQVGLLLGLVALWQMADGEPVRALREAVTFGAVFALVAAPILIPTLLTQVDAPPIPNDGLTTFEVTAWLRQAHHYLLSAQPVSILIKASVVVFIGLVGLVLLRRQTALPVKHLRVTGRMLVLIAGLVGVYVVMTESAESLTVAKMQVFRLTLVAKLVLLTWASGAALSMIPTSWRETAERAFERPRLGWATAAVLVVGTVGLASADAGRPGAMWHPRDHTSTDLYRAERAIRESTPRDALFLVPPSTTTFRSHALRSVAINFKPTTFRDDKMHEWLARLRTVAPAPLPDRSAGGDAVMAWRASLDSAYHVHSPTEWTRLGETFGADYALVDRTQTPTPPSGEPVIREGRWAVYALRGVGDGEAGRMEFR